MSVIDILSTSFQGGTLLLGGVVVVRFHVAAKRHNEATQRHNEVEAHERDVANFEASVGRTVLLLHYQLDLTEDRQIDVTSWSLDRRMFPVPPQPPTHHVDLGDSVLAPGLPVFAVACAYVTRSEFRGVNRRRMNAHDPFDAIEATLGDFGLAATWSAEHPPPDELAVFCSRDGEVARVSSIAPVNRPSYDFAVLVYKGCFVWAHRL